jgi:hypothetical protein
MTLTVLHEIQAAVASSKHITSDLIESMDKLDKIVEVVDNKTIDEIILLYDTRYTIENQRGIDTACLTSGIVRAKQFIDPTRAVEDFI